MPLLLVWNASASTTRGLYLVLSAAAVRRGDMVLARAPESARRLAAARGYLPYEVPMVKRVAASAGDTVCASGGVVAAGRQLAVRQAADAKGRPLPSWKGCLRLAGGEALLLGEHPNSFDSRYFGPVGRAGLLGRAILLWRA